MNLHDNLEAAITSSCSTSGVALLAGFDQVSWSNYHVFRGIGTGELIKSVNRGRLPVIFIRREDSSYVQENIGPTTGGTVESTYKITLMAGETSRASELPSERLLYQLASVILSDLRKQWIFRQGSDDISSITPLPFGYKLEITLKVDLSYDQDNR